MSSNRNKNAPQHLPSGPFGFGDAVWECAKSQVREILVSAAQKRQMIPYSVLVSQLDISLEAHDVRFFSLLGEVSAEEHEHGRPLLSVLVVHKTGDMQPGPGFFELARSLGRDTSDMTTLWVEEFKRVFAYWSSDH